MRTLCQTVATIIAISCFVANSGLAEEPNRPPPSPNANGPIGRQIRFPTRRITDDGPFWAIDRDGNHIAKISNFELLLTTKYKTNDELHPYFQVQYDFDNTLKGGTMDGVQNLYVDLLDSSGNVVFKTLLTFALPRSRCWTKNVKEEGFLAFDWQKANIQHVELRMPPVTGGQKGC
jgi:hypothetical protein